MKIKLHSLLTIIFIFMPLFATDCVSTKSTQAEAEKKTQRYYQNQSIEELKDLWLATQQYNERQMILRELERRKASDALRSCYVLAGFLTGPSNFLSPKEDRLFIIQALGRLKERNAVPLLSKLLGDKNSVLRTAALDALGKIQDPNSVESILPLLFDDDPSIRAQAIHTLGEIGDPRAMGRISLLLADKDPFVKEIAEANLKRLGASKEKIRDWKRKAEGLTIDDVYTAKLSYEKTLTEKAALQAKLNTETDIKRQLEKSLKEREVALKLKEDLVESLYEKERELKSKLAQLDIAKQQSEEYQKELERLNIKVQALNKEITQARSKSATKNVKEELDKTLQKKSELESDVKLSRARESVFEEEISDLTADAERTRMEAEDAKKELAAMRDRETELVRQVGELKKRLNRGMAPVVVVSKPENGIKVQMPTTMLHVVAVDDKGISDFVVMLNGRPLKLSSTRGIRVSAAEDEPKQKKIAITEKLQLAYGQNIIEVTATDTDGTTTNEIITITRDKERGDVWAAVIGINQYPNARPLKYAVNDALAFKHYLKNYIGLPEDHIFFLSNQNATRDNIQSLLGTKLKRRASKEDTVIIFYTGHGAVETDPTNPDGDGFEKYLLPYDAELTLHICKIHPYY
jgi:HEAT repeat protein